MASQNILLKSEPANMGPTIYRKANKAYEFPRFSPKTSRNPRGGTVIEIEKEGGHPAD